MSKRLLQWMGVAAIVGGCGLSVAGFINVKEHLTVTVASEPGADTVDPIAILGDDLVLLRTDFRQLAEQLGTSLGQLSENLASAVTDSSTDLGRRLDLFESRLTRLVERQAELSGQLAGLSAALSSPSGARQSGPQKADSTAEQPKSDSPVQVTQNIPAPATRAAKKFLNFSFSPTAFEFDKPHHFQIIGSLSRVGFDAKSTLHDFTGVTSKVRGEFEVALGSPGNGCRGQITVEAGTLLTGVEGRDEEMYSVLSTATHPQLRFDLTGIEPSEVNATAKTMTGTAVGTLSIAGTSQDIRFPVKLSVDPSRRVEVTGELSLNMSDYGITPPSQLGMIHVDDEVRVWIALRARVSGSASQLAEKAK